MPAVPHIINLRTPARDCGAEMSTPALRDRSLKLTVLVTACALLAVLAHPVRSAQRTSFDHLTSGYELQGAHRDLPCESCHVNGIFKGTPRTCQGCHTIGSWIDATARPVTHMATQDRCELCHALYTFTPAYRVDHSATRGTCFSCHNNVTAQGKKPDHVPADNNCDACHTTVAFVPNRVEHADLVARTVCRGCHAGIRATAMPRNHAMTSRECGDCHGTLTWSPAHFNHTGMSADCQSCHNGILASGKVASHPATVQDCSACHRFPDWTVPLQHTTAGVADGHPKSPQPAGHHKVIDGGRH